MAKTTKPEHPDFLTNDDRWSKSEKTKMANIAWEQADGNPELYTTLLREHCSGSLDLFETEKK